MEGDTTAFYINKRIKDIDLKISVIARGVPVGGDLEYADEITLGRSITGRTLFN
jgi:recombination protein RecR